MKRNLFLALLITALSFSFMFGFNVKETKADSAIQLSYAGGKNLLDPNNLVGNQTRYSTINNIYLPDTTMPLFFQVYFNWARPIAPEVVAVEFFDIDMVSIGISFGSDGDLDYDSNETYVGTIMVEDIPSNAFSFKVLYIADFEEEFLELGGRIMIFSGDEMADEFEEFYPHIGLYNISESEMPIIEVSYDAPLTIDEIKEMVYCSDGYLGDLKRSLVVEAGIYLTNKNITGLYEVKCSVSDGTNTTKGSFYLKVVDRDFPTLTGPDKIYFSIGETVTDQMIKEQFVPYDGYDAMIPASIEIVGTYPQIVNQITVTPLTLRLADSSGNTIEKEITIYYRDTNAPTIEAPESIVISYQLRMKIGDIIKNHVTVSDTIDQAPVLTVTQDEYSGNERRIGTYNVTVEATDSSNNTVSKDMSITVTDDIAPVIYLNSYAIDVTSSVNLSKLDFENIAFRILNGGKNKKYSSKVLLDTYTGHENEPGTYTYKMLITTDEGEEIEKEFIINVGDNLYIIDTQAVKQMSYKNIALIVVASTIAVLGLALAYLGIRSKKLTKIVNK